jgi:hypothetical protein
VRTKFVNTTNNYIIINNEKRKREKENKNKENLEKGKKNTLKMIMMMKIQISKK